MVALGRLGRRILTVVVLVLCVATPASDGADDYPSCK